MDLYASSNAEHILKRLERWGDPLGLGVSPTLSIEHVMPQKLSKKWESALGSQAARIRDQWSHTIGNLTLTPYNSPLGQKTFEEKKNLEPGGFNTSKLWLSKSLLKYDAWTEEAIRQRGNELMGVALEVWPMPSIFSDSYKPIESVKTPRILAC